MYTLTEVHKKVFLARFLDSFQLVMIFLRYNEGTESDNPRWLENAFTLYEFIEWYSHLGSDLSFTYAEDWAGFNLSSTNIQEVIARGIPDITKWDREMMTILSLCTSRYPGEEVTIVGIPHKAESDDPHLIPHEIAHAFYVVDENYKNRVDELYNELPLELQDRICQILKGYGYGDDALVDETHAYLATGWDDLDEFLILEQSYDLEKAALPFKTLFEKRNSVPFTPVTIVPFTSTV